MMRGIVCALLAASVLSLVFGVGFIFGHDLPSPEGALGVHSLHEVISQLKARHASMDETTVPEGVMGASPLIDGGKTPSRGRMFFVIGAMNAFPLYAGYRIAVRYFKHKALRAFVPMAILVVFFMIINALILGQPMAMRHTHGG